MIYLMYFSELSTTYSTLGGSGLGMGWEEITILIGGLGTGVTGLGTIIGLAGVVGICILMGLGI